MYTPYGTFLHLRLFLWNLLGQLRPLLLMLPLEVSSLLPPSSHSEVLVPVVVLASGTSFTSTYYRYRYDSNTTSTGTCTTGTTVCFHITRNSETMHD